MAGPALGIAYFAARYWSLSALDIEAHHGWSIGAWFIVVMTLVAVHESGEKPASGLVIFSLVILGLGCLGLAADEMFVAHAGCEAAFSPEWSGVAERVSVAWLALAAGAAFFPSGYDAALGHEAGSDVGAERHAPQTLPASAPTVVLVSPTTTREIVIVKLRCSYCGGLVDQGVARCGSCDGQM